MATRSNGKTRHTVIAMASLLSFIKPTNRTVIVNSKQLVLIQVRGSVAYNKKKKQRERKTRWQQKWEAGKFNICRKVSDWKSHTIRFNKSKFSLKWIAKKRKSESHTGRVEEREVDEIPTTDECKKKKNESLCETEMKQMKKKTTE